MSRRKPRAHLFLEGGGMVTGTHDRLLAQRLIIDEWLDQRGDRCGKSILDALRIFSLQAAEEQVGRVVPEAPEAREWSGYAWWWRSGYKLGKPGVTRAVVWNA